MHLFQGLLFLCRIIMKAIFEKETTINAILYILQKLGGRHDMHGISKILFFADMDHLAKWGRLITGDAYIAMENGPVPSKIYDIFKYLRGDSYFFAVKDDVRNSLHMINRYTVEALAVPDMDWLSESDIECLDKAIAKCKGLSMRKLTELSHGLAYSHTQRDRKISYKDMLREAGCTEGYIDYVEENFNTRYALCANAN